MTCWHFSSKRESSSRWVIGGMVEPVFTQRVATKNLKLSPRVEVVNRGVEATAIVVARRLRSELQGVVVLRARLLSSRFRSGPVGQNASEQPCRETDSDQDPERVGRQLPKQRRQRRIRSRPEPERQDSEHLDEQARDAENLASKSNAHAHRPPLQGGRAPPAHHFSPLAIPVRRGSL